MLVVNLVWDGIPDNRIYPQINTNWLSKCIHQSPWWIIYESTKIVFGQTLQLKRWLISMSCHPEEREKRGFLESEAQRSMAIELALTGLRKNGESCMRTWHFFSAIFTCNWIYFHTISEPVVIFFPHETRL